MIEFSNAEGLVSPDTEKNNFSFEKFGALIDRLRNHHTGGSRAKDKRMNGHIESLDPTENEFIANKAYLYKLKAAVLKTNPDFINDHINNLDRFTAKSKIDNVDMREPIKTSNPHREDSMFFELVSNPEIQEQKIELLLSEYANKVMKPEFAKENLSADDALLFYYDMLTLEPGRLLHTKEPLTDLQEKVIKSLETLKKYTLLLKSNVKDADGNKIYNPLEKMKMIRNTIDVSTTKIYDEKTLTQLEIDNSDDTIVDENTVTQGRDNSKTLIARPDTKSSLPKPKVESHEGDWLD